LNDFNAVIDGRSSYPPAVAAAQHGIRFPADTFQT